MSSNSFVPEMGSSSQSRLADSEGDGYPSSSKLNGPRQLQTGKRGRPPIDPAQKGLVERRRNQVRKAQQTYRIRRDEEAAFRINYVVELENRIKHMRQSFLELSSHLTGASIHSRQPDLMHTIQNITHDFLSASQPTKPFSESLRDDECIKHTPSGHDSHSSSLGGSSNIYTSCATESPVPTTVSIGMSMPILVSALESPSTFFRLQTPLPRNFAQRLYSSCIKRAYYLLTSPYADRNQVAHVFQYSFQYSDANTMISTFNTLLQTNGDYQTAYVYRLGGAGTHYPKTQMESGVVQNVPLGEQTPFKNNNEDMWFDPRDIEGWLEENGLVIGGTQSFMYLSELPSFGPCRDTMTLCPGLGSSEFPERDYQRNAMILNVDQFLQELLSRGVCMGNAPGFRRLDVEAAFNLAISDEMTFIREP